MRSMVSVSCMTLATATLSLALAGGCSRTISEKETATHKSDGSSSVHKETVKENPDGTVSVKKETSSHK